MRPIAPQAGSPLVDADTGKIRSAWLGWLQQIAQGLFPAGVTIGDAGPSWTTGTVAPTAVAPVGSLYSRVGGAVGATLYVSRGAGAWLAVAGV